MLTDSEAPSARVGPHPASDHSGRWSPEGGGAEKVYLQVPALKKPTDQFRPFQGLALEAALKCVNLSILAVLWGFPPAFPSLSLVRGSPFPPDSLAEHLLLPFATMRWVALGGAGGGLGARGCSGVSLWARGGTTVLGTSLLCGPAGALSGSGKVGTVVDCHLSLDI